MTNRPVKKFSGDLQRGIKSLERELNRDMMTVIGKRAVDQFQESFSLGGFIDGGLKKWKEVKRRDPASKWFGFEYKGERRTSYKLTRDRKTGKTRKSAVQKALNFSTNATTRKILTSRRMELRNSLRYHAGAGKVNIVSDKKYARVQNEGGVIKVFGKHPVKLPARQFMGPSKELNDKVQKEIEQRVKEAFNIR